MILADTSVWLDHLRSGDDPAFSYLLEADTVVTHPFVVGELAMGNLRGRETILGLLNDLQQAVVASHDEVMAYVSRHELFGLGIGYVDAHLLASTRLTHGVKLWTKDKRLRSAAERLELHAGFG